MHIAICDDEQAFINKFQTKLNNLLTRYVDNWEILTCNSGSDLLYLCRDQNYSYRTTGS